MFLIRALPVFLLPFLSTTFATAGDQVEPLSPKSALFEAPEDPDSWAFELRPYLWTVSLEGDMGVNGIVTPVDLSFGDIIDNLDFAAAATFTAEKGRWAFFLEGNYLKISPSIDEVPFQLFNTVGIEVEQLLLSGGVFYRVAEWDRGFLDVGVGAIYVYSSTQLNFDVSDAGVASLSDQIASDVVDRVAGEIRSEVDRRLSQIMLPNPPSGNALDRLADRISRRVSSGGAQDVVRNTLASDIASQANPELGNIGGNGEIKDRIRELVKASAAERAANKVSGVKSRVAKKAAKARAQAERKLSQALQRQIRSKIPSSVEVSEGWVDPIIAARMRHFLTERLYFNLFGSYGGFGVGSDVNWQVGVGPGLIVNDWLTLEFYYRHMYIDYEDDGFLFDADLSGLFLGAVIRW